MKQFEQYKRFYPDKWEAISALRCDTGLDFAEANRIINNLFGMNDDDELKAADAEHEALYQAQETQKAELKARAGTTGKKTAVLAGVGLFAAIRSIFSLSQKDK